MSAQISLSVVICTHNPRLDVLEQTIASIREQKPLRSGCDCELILLDNASTVSLKDRVNISGFSFARVVSESKLGLIHARLRSFHEAQGEVILYVDDDNVLDADYLRETLEAFMSDPTLGAVGGKAVARYETVPPAWFESLNIELACRDLGDEPISATWQTRDENSRKYPNCAPIGAGMAVRRLAYKSYIDSAMSDPDHLGLGRCGTDLSSGEDNDIVMTILEAGWKVAYLPQLRLEHLIPTSRLDASYLSRYAYSSSRTWVQVLDLHGIRPWPAIGHWTAPLRKCRGFFREQAWASPANHIRWRGACGLIDGRALIRARKSVQDESRMRKERVPFLQDL